MLVCQVDGSVIGTTPLVPVEDSTATSFEQHVALAASSASTQAPGHRFTSFASIGVSLFSYTFTAPSTPGVHTLTAVATTNGTTIPVTASGVSVLFAMCEDAVKALDLPMASGLPLTQASLLVQ